MELRLLFAAPILLAYCAARGRLAELGASWRDGLVLGVFGVAVPFTLVGWGASHVDAGTTAVANAAVPLFVTLIALKVLPGERATGLRLLGLLLGLGGVALLAGLRPPGGAWGVAGTLAVVAAAPSYALATLFAQRRLATGGLVLATGSLVFGALALLPLAVATAPPHLPGAGTIAAVIALGVLATAIPHAAYYRLVSARGASRSALVTYTSPVFALVLGAVFLGEPTTLPKLGGLVLVVAGVALGAGIRRSPAVGAVAPAPAAAVAAAAPARPWPIRRARATAPNA
jgi:drug/metabolite transporter (DMT)-like permease